MSSKSYLDFIGGPADLDPFSLPTTGDVLRYVSYCASPKLSGDHLLSFVSERLIEVYCCLETRKNLARYSSSYHIIVCTLKHF